MLYELLWKERCSKPLKQNPSRYSKVYEIISAFFTTVSPFYRKTFSSYWEFLWFNYFDHLCIKNYYNYCLRYYTTLSLTTTLFDVQFICSKTTTLQYIITRCFEKYRIPKGLEDFGNSANILIRVKVYKNGPSKICGRQPLKYLKWYRLYLMHHIPLLKCLINLG